jgi:predicted transcriptional regulator
MSSFIDIRVNETLFTETISISNIMRGKNFLTLKVDLYELDRLRIDRNYHKSFGVLTKVPKLQVYQ